MTAQSVGRATTPARSAAGSRLPAAGAGQPAGGAAVGYAQLWAADPGAWRAVGAAWGGLTDLVDRRAGDLGERATALGGGWSGAAATAASGRLAGVRSDLASAAPALIEADQVLAEYAGRLAAAKGRLAAAVALADASGLLIDRDGRVSADPARARPSERDGPAAARVAAALRAALELAGAADQTAGARLDALAASAGTGWLAAPPPGRPERGATPAQVRAWWAGLTPAQRRWLVAHEPVLVGHLDGVPAAARDQANRLLLGVRRAELLAERRRLLDRVPPGPVETARLRLVDARLAGLDGLTDRLTEPGGPRAYLLGLDTAGEGRVVVALGDPDHADRVLTYVPGMTAGLDDAPGELGRAARVLDRCAALAPEERSAAVLWLDYDARDLLHEAISARQAQDAGPALQRFQEGLRATHEGPPARQTVLGHSYGSLVVGTTARDHGLAADALVFVGSPGVGVAHAEELRHPPGQVWASSAPDDVIRLARPPDELALGALRGASPLAAALALPGRGEHELWFGRDPAAPGFGGRVFPSGRHGHTGYWDADNPALDGVARIVLGR
ncbi:alpha/beta hydrolase [Micromonospora sp. WMMD812]|uniref:alpha/beta hydrolase n=1 Tax=Micromonospora sp. WMMD812 TaxID=3015152 RepID=UPI00248B5823|nr:alpha/beta hydrolase [Micromonospora sp. WMMD812]WBB66437.1 alpha/beta hydrolase [Micromonospora sp. WMMD812]